MQNNIVFRQHQPAKKIILLLLLQAVLVCVGCQGNSSSSRPLIGITSVYQVDKDDGSVSSIVGFEYVKAVAENDGAPVILPTITNEEILQRYIEELDGLILVGGDDIPPDAYGQQPHETVKVMPQQRYDFERQLIPAWLSCGKPILGVCLGMQFTNVVSGGTLIQDIPSQVGIKVDHRKKYHHIRIEQGSLLSNILDNNEAMVYSNHHQAVDKPGRDMKVIAHADDGVIEAAERTKGGFGLFVQWHPESMKDIEHRDAIYGSLVRAAAQKRSYSQKSKRN